MSKSSPLQRLGYGSSHPEYTKYEDITGKKLDNDAKLVGTQELTVTAELADEIGSADSTAIVNQLKLILDQTKDMTDDQLREEIKKIAAEYDVSLTDSQIDSLVSLCRSMEKLDTAAPQEKGRAGAEVSEGYRQ